MPDVNYRQAVMFHVGDHTSELEMGEVDLETEGQPSTLGTGVGTDHDAASIIPRPTYRWEGKIVQSFYPIVC